MAKGSAQFVVQGTHLSDFKFHNIIFPQLVLEEMVLGLTMVDTISLLIQKIYINLEPHHLPM